MKTRTIIWPEWEIRAWLEGRKSRFMVPIKPQPEPGDADYGGQDNIGQWWLWRGEHGDESSEPWCSLPNPPIQPGDVVAVREKFSAEASPSKVGYKFYIKYWADEFERFMGEWNCHKRSWDTLEPWAENAGRCMDNPSEPFPASQMPAKLARIRPKVLAVRVGRVMDLKSNDAIDEGCPEDFRCERCGYTILDCGLHCDHKLCGELHPAIQWFMEAWNAHYAKRGLGTDSNPWCWIYDIKRAEVR